MDQDPEKRSHRGRMRCPLCNDILGYSAYKRHQDLPRLFCPGYVPPAKRHHDDDVSDSSDSTFILEESTAMSPQSSLHVDVDHKITDFDRQLM